MKFKAQINIPSLLEAVHQCEYNVIFTTKEGDQLNLKSTLSQFVFTAVIAGTLNNLDGEITFHPQDKKFLATYLAE